MILVLTIVNKQYAQGCSQILPTIEWLQEVQFYPTSIVISQKSSRKVHVLQLPIPTFNIPWSVYFEAIYAFGNMGKMMSSSNKCYLTVAGFCPSQSNLPFLLRATSSSPGACQSYSSPRLSSSAAYSTCTMGETNGATNGASNGATQVCSLIHFSATYELKHDILKSRRVAKTFVKNWVDIF